MQDPVTMAIEATCSMKAAKDLQRHSSDHLRAISKHIAYSTSLMLACRALVGRAAILTA